MAALLADNLPVPPPNEALLALGIEGSANKVGVGLIRYVPATGAYDILANPRETYVTPRARDFRPARDGADYQGTSCRWSRNVCARPASTRPRSACATRAGPAWAARCGAARGGGCSRGCGACPCREPLRGAHRDGPRRDRRQRPVVLYVSGGNTRCWRFGRRYCIFGETIDIAVGNWSTGSAGFGVVE